MTVYYHDNNHSNQALVENDKGLGGIILSLACLRKIVEPNVIIPSLLKESDKRPPLSFALSQIIILRRELQLPYKYLQDTTEDLENYINDIYTTICETHTHIIPIYNTPKEKASLPVILSCLEQQVSDLGPIDWWKVKSIDFAIILGFILGDAEWYACPRPARLNMLQIGTGIALGLYRSRYPAHAPDSCQTPPMQRNTRQPANFDSGSGSNLGHHFRSPCNVQSEPGNAAPSRGPQTTAFPLGLPSTILRPPPGLLPPGRQQFPPDAESGF